MKFLMNCLLRMAEELEGRLVLVVGILQGGGFVGSLGRREVRVYAAQYEIDLEDP